MPRSRLRHLPASRLIVGGVLVCLVGLAPGTGEVRAAADEQDDGMMGSEQPRIPEPMVFDLVRPLGSTRGELEINTLLQQRPDGTLEWAPEIEYTVADGLALEFELPAENARREATKLAAQGTFRRGRTDRFIHGWQAIGVERRTDGARSVDGVYIAGYRFDERWSALAMTGFRLDAVGRGTARSALSNASIFYNLREHATVGLEFNGRWGQAGRSLSYIPQFHLRLADHWSLQTGIEITRRRGAAQRASATARVIYAF